MTSPMERWQAVHGHRDRPAQGDPLLLRHGLTLMQRDLELDNSLRRPFQGEGADAIPAHLRLGR